MSIVKEHSGLFTSNTDMWSTPQALFDELDAEFHFDTDVCAIPSNAKCKHFYTPSQDGLAQEWGGSCYCNPPYGRQIGKWVRKAYESHCTTVMLLPARTDTKWFHDYIYGKAEIRFIRGRLYFNDGKGRAPFPSMIVIFRNELKGEKKMTNREYINTLTNEELANYIYDVISVVGKEYTSSRKGVAEWLGMPKDAKYARAENCKMEGSFSECLKCGACGRLFKNGYLV